jgi:DivIVA domain-containing protein
MADVHPDRRPVDLPDEPLRPGDLDQLRFGVGLRGYRMDQVDAVLDRVAAELAHRDQLIAGLEARVNAWVETDVETQVDAQIEASAGPHEVAPDE